MISVIVPIYKVEEYLEECIKSIVNQSYTNLEIILVDDGSPDSCGKICDEWAKVDKRIVVIHQSNKGISQARNVGLKRVTGDYVSFVDSDDVLHPRMYQFLLDALVKNEADISICHEDAFDDGIYRSRNYSNYTIESVEDTECLKKHFMDAWTGPINFVWNKLYRREIVSNLLFPVGRKMEDIWFSVEALSKVKKAVWINERLYGYRQRIGSIMNSGDATVFQQHGEAILHQREVLKLKEYDAYALRKLAHLGYEAKAAGVEDGEEAVRKLFVMLHKEIGSRNLSLKDKCNAFLARYCWRVYCVLHDMI